MAESLPASDEKLGAPPTDRSTISRSAVSTAASSVDTISSNEDVHTYEDWELSSETDGESELSSARDDGDKRVFASASRPSSSWGCCRETSPSREALDTCEELDGRHRSSSSNQAHLVQDTEDPVEDTPESSRLINELDSTRSQGSDSADESLEWTNEPDDEVIDADLESTPRSRRDGLDEGYEPDRPGNVSIEERLVTADAQQMTPRAANSPNEQDSRHGKQSIRVFVRVRPLATWSSEGGEDSVVVRPGDDDKSIRVQSSGSHGNNCIVTECSFDQVFMERSRQEEVFVGVQPSVRAALDGYNATVFAYGQTGTGKTHTIFGDDADSGAEKYAVKSTWGIIPRALALLLDQAEAMGSAGICVALQLSFMQIYNDRLFDLLIDRRRQRPLLIREQPTIEGGTNVVLQGLSSESVETLDGALQLLRRGRTNRTVRETELNSSSSRSHAIVQINITSERSAVNGERLTRKSRLNLVDLAGSEKWNTDLEMDEAHSFELKNINSSLSALGNCIAALSEAGRKHIPYRDSTLTRVLQDSFGGNTQACLIATVSPSARASDETIRTLQFADRARSVMQSVRVNETLSGVSELQIAKAQIAKLKERLESEQRRRHQTRIKEQEAAQKDFLDKLQVKEKEIQRLARDNAVFSRWREEDLKKIRELESRVKEFDTKGGTDTAPKGAEAALTHSATTPKQKQREKREPPLVSATLPASDIRRVNSKQSISSQGAPTAPRRTDTISTKPYKQILERYALGSKKSHRRQEEDRAHETAAPRLSANGSQRSGEQPCLEAAPSTSTNQDHYEHDSVDLQRGQCETKLPEIDQGGSCVRARVTATFTAEPVAAPPLAGRYSSLWKLGTSQSVLSNHPVPAGMQQQSGIRSPLQTAWSSQRELYDQATRTGSLLQNHSSLQAPTPALGSFASPARSSENEQHAQTIAAPNTRALSRLPDPVTPVEIRDLMSSNAFPAQNPPSLAPSVSSTCEKHSLKGCVLCAVRDSRPSYASAIAPPASLPSTSTVDPAFTSAPAKAREVPCDRHQLANCFICSSSGGITLPASFSSSASASAAAPSSQQTLARSESGPSAVGAANRLSSDAKCAAHSLANCVLCAGVKPTAKTVPLEAPSRSTDAPLLLASTYGWASNQNLVLETNTSESLSVSTRQAAADSALHQPSLLRRHSIEFGSIERNDLIPSASPGKVAAHLRPQHSAVDIHRQPHNLSSVETASSGLRGSLTESPLSGSQSAKASWQPTEMRSTIQELAFDSNRKSYQVLIREASGAAATALRRK